MFLYNLLHKPNTVLYLTFSFKNVFWRHKQKGECPVQIGADRNKRSTRQRMQKTTSNHQKLGERHGTVFPGAFTGTMVLPTPGLQNSGYISVFKPKIKNIPWRLYLKLTPLK